MDRHEARGAVATASMLRQLADEIEDGVVWIGDGQLPVTDAWVSAATDCAMVADGRLSVTVQVEAPLDWRPDEHAKPSELERELAHPGD